VGVAQGNTGDSAYKSVIRGALAKFCGKFATLILRGFCARFTPGEALAG